jgi:hypothetical protein
MKLAYTLTLQERSVLKKLFDLGQFAHVWPSCSGNPHAQHCPRGSNNRRDLMKTKIGIFNKPPEVDNQCLFTRVIPFHGIY